jgi:hypothetical protein
MSENFAEQYRYSKFGLNENEHELIHKWNLQYTQRRIYVCPFSIPKDFKVIHKGMVNKL